MMTNKEYTSYATKRKGLRVSNKVDDTAQRGTYYLQVPYRYGIPLLILSILLHFFTSQAFFTFQIEYVQADGNRGVLVCLMHLISPLYFLWLADFDQLEQIRRC